MPNQAQPGRIFSAPAKSCLACKSTPAGNPSLSVFSTSRLNTALLCFPLKSDTFSIYGRIYSGPVNFHLPLIAIKPGVNRLFTMARNFHHVWLVFIPLHDEQIQKKTKTSLEICYKSETGSCKFAQVITEFQR